VSWVPSGARSLTLRVAPGGDDRLGQRLGAAVDQPPGQGGRVGHLERDPDRPGDAGADLDLVDQLGLPGREQLKGGPAGVQDDPAAPRPLEGLDHRQAEDVAVERHRLVVALDGQGQPQLANRALGHLAPLATGDRRRAGHHPPIVTAVTAGRQGRA
jgi:hypothetical protein